MKKPEKATAPKTDAKQKELRQMILAHHPASCRAAHKARSTSSTSTLAA